MKSLFKALPVKNNSVAVSNQSEWKYRCVESASDY